MEASEPSPSYGLLARRERLHRYGWALGIVCLAIVLRVWLEPVVGREAGVLFWVAILVCPWIGGLVPSLIGQTLIWAAQWYWFTPPSKTPWRPTLGEFLFIVLYYLLGSTIGAASDLRRRAQQRERIQRAEAISQREQLRATLSCMADGVLVTDEQGRLTLMNPTAETITGWTMEESRGKRLPEFFAVHCESSEHGIVDPLDQVLRSGEVIQGAMIFRLTTRSGAPMPISHSAAPIRNAEGNIIGAVLVFRDESERRRIEHALRDADRQKDEFLATLAHELRNPLAPICMGVDLLQMPAQGPEATADVCAMMARQSQHMVHLIDDLLDVSRITRGKLQLRQRQVALDEVVQNAVDANRTIIDQARLRLAVNLPAHPILLDADPSRLTQVFSNLLNNAAKFTPPDGSIELSAEIHGGDVMVTVTDSGIGIPADKQESIFEMFTQVDGGCERPAGGLGIGLTLVKRLVEMHGGKISVESAGHNLGSRFRVQLPMIPEERNAGESPNVNRSLFRAPKRRVLIVDDNPDALASLSMVVRALGSEAFDAHDGLEAVESARNLRPDVILMDIGMPRLNGYDAARRIRQEPWGQNLLMVATTGWGKEEDRQRSKEAGFDVHLVKPIEMTAVQEVLSSPTHAQRNLSLRVGSTKPS